MNLKEAVAAARQRVEEMFAADAPCDIRLEGFLYDDHLMVWSLTIGFALSDHAGETPGPAGPTRHYRMIRVSEADKSVLSVADR